MEEESMSQINVDPDNGVRRDDNAGARTAATSNLTWAIGLILVIAAIAIAVVYVAHNVVK